MQLAAVLSAICSTATMATLVVFGLLMIPVECSVAMGPHTIFVSADAVAALQDDARQPHGGHGTHAVPERAEPDAAASASSTTSHQAHGAPQTGQAEATQDIADHIPDDAPSPDDAAPRERGMTYPARPAGISADAVVALDIPGGQPDLLGPISDSRVRFAFTMPPDRFLTGPEPPPP
jgi:hypothetical protein